MQEDFEEADDARVVDLDAGIAHRADGDRKSKALQQRKVDMDIEPLIGSGLAAERQVMAATVAPFRGRGEMPRPKVAMRRIKEVLRLKEGLGLSDTAVSRSVRIARSTVKEYLDRAAAVGLNWEAVAELSEEELDRRLFAAVDTRHWDRPLPDWEAVEKELRGRGVTLRLLWLEYLSRHPDGYRYTQFCAHFHAWQRHSRPPTMRRQHRAGEAPEVDYAGMTLSVIDKDVVRQAQVFVACLPCSDLTYAEASWTQGHEDWLGAHVRAFAYIGALPEKVIPDYVPGHIIGVLCPLRLCGGVAAT